MDLMAYFVNLAFWTIVIEGYCVIATKKIMSDLPEMGQKTIEASLKRLKEVGLIETTIVEVIALKKKVKELEATIEQLTVSTEEKNQNVRNPSVHAQTTEAKPSDSEFAGFVNVIKQGFGTSGEPICNFVPTWLKETTFYINSYNKLALVTPKGEYKQLVDPIAINRFWH